ncbi:fumarylacetoacetate hydrolase family protein [Curvivirga aplysinae]|uniref:fumarylacetoacetate hydrolase family protein n=1 Tax=Curvivirga aplysinae TaxID=2529852 RepID=UPI0012BD1C3B|nr:fumarylacetoacetate hydrolase family protein [Curvivirga aplysinae]MTI11494.1 FAA hydrolase family protein [Curvivirga aplysinae]
MTDFVITAPPQVSIPVKDSSSKFPVRRVYCIGRNYADHAIEMGHDPDKEPPFFFQKDADNLVSDGVFPYPVQSNDVHHEVEMLAALKSGGRNISVNQALEHVYGYAVCLDMTRRDLQAVQKKMRRPWEIGKSFEASAPVGIITPVSENEHLSDALIELKVNGEVRQTGNLNQMIWKVAEMISYLSDYFELAAGDVILSGTPAGVGPVERGDKLCAHIDGLEDLHVSVV